MLPQGTACPVDVDLMLTGLCGCRLRLQELHAGLAWSDEHAALAVERVGWVLVRSAPICDACKPALRAKQRTTRARKRVPAQRTRGASARRLLSSSDRSLSWRPAAA